MRQIHPNSRIFKEFISFWAKYCALEEFHLRWSARNMQQILLRRNQVLYGQGDPQRYLYYVSRGMIAHIQHGNKNRRIFSIAVRGMSLTTTTHLFSCSAVPGEIVALRSGSVLRIPYRAIHENLEQDGPINTLLSVLTNKQYRFLQLIRRSCLSDSPRERYRQFAALLPDLLQQTTQREHADLLGISRDTVQKTKKELLFSR